MTSITPPPGYPPISFDEGAVVREGAHAYDMGKSFDQHGYTDTRRPVAFKRGWFSRKAELERKS